MVGNERDYQWVPREMHGVVSLPDGADVRKVVEQAIKTLVPRGYRSVVESFHYAIYDNPDGSKSVVFEVVENG